jgi:hypothetical protein
MSVLGDTVSGQAPGIGAGGGALTPDEQNLVGGGTGTPLAASSPINVGITQAAPAPAQPQQPAAPAPQPSRLQQILGAVAKVAVTGLQGIPDKGRPSFVTGLGQGARAEQAEINNQQAIKFRDLDSQIRLAELHNQDVKMQNDTQAQQDAHVKADLDNRSLANSLGIDYDSIVSHGPTVMDHLASQTSANGAATIPPGTHLAGDGESINIPKDTQATRDGQKQMYSMLAPALGLSPLPPGAQFVPPQNMNQLTNMLHGFNRDGSTPNHDDLPGMIGAAKAQRDLITKMNATPEQSQALDNRIAILQANLDALDKHKASVLAQNKQSELDVENSPANQASAAQGAGLKAGAEAKAKFPTELALAQAKAAQKADTTNLDSVAYDPTYKNPDGTIGANVVISKEDAKARGLQHYKADPSTINTVVGGMNDVQNKLNQLASVVNDPQKMGQVNAPVAAAMLAHGKGISLEIGAHGGGGGGGVGLDMSNINEALYSRDVQKANQATRDFVSAFIGAHEAITQLPRLQTFGKSNRMTEKQMEAAINLLPQPGDGNFASQKMTSLQGMIDPLRKQIPHMPGADLQPSWLEQRRQNQPPSSGSNLGQAVMGNDPFSRLVPSR